jgi:predicted DNA-binding transcriptional regulator
MGLNKDRIIGVAITVGSVAGIVAYGWLIYAFPLIVLQATAFIAITVLLGILAWIGWTMTTTPQPTPIKELESTLSVGQSEQLRSDLENKGG